MKMWIILVVMIFSSACKLSSSDLDKNQNQNTTTKIGEISTQSDRKLTMLEKEILNRVCVQLKKKRELFESLDYLKEKQVYKRNNRDCNGGITGLGEIEVLLDNSAPREMIWNVSGPGEFLKDIITDNSSSIRTFCETVTKDINIEIQNALVTNNVKTVLNIYIDSGYDKIELVNSIKKKDQFKATSAESMVFFTQSVQAPAKVMGMEKSRARFTLCENGRTSYLKQDFMRLLTKFEKN